jgi:hypothetical protein
MLIFTGLGSCGCLTVMSSRPVSVSWHFLTRAQVMGRSTRAGRRVGHAVVCPVAMAGIGRRKSRPRRIRRPGRDRTQLSGDSCWSMQVKVDGTPQLALGCDLSSVVRELMMSVSGSPVRRGTTQQGCEAARAATASTGRVGAFLAQLAKTTVHLLLTAYHLPL